MRRLLRAEDAATGLRVDEVRPATATEWDEAYDSCPHATYFHSREWIEAWAAVGAGRLRPAPTAAHFSDGARAVLVVTRERRRGGRWPRALSGPAGTYGGWVAGPEVGVAHQRLLTRLMCSAASEVWWRVNPFDPLAALVDDGVPRAVTLRHDETDALPLGAGFEAVQRGFSRGHRSAANKARRLGVTVRHARTADDWEAYLRVVSDSLDRWGGRGGPAHHPVKLFARLRSGAATTLWLAEYERRVVAGALCFSSGRHSVYWHGAALADAFGLRPSTLLLATAIESACDRGAEWFDFNPSAGLAGVREFKRRFGARPLPCPVVTYAAPHVRMTERLLRLAGRRQQGRNPTRAEVTPRRSDPGTSHS